MSETVFILSEEKYFKYLDKIDPKREFIKYLGPMPYDSFSEYYKKLDEIKADSPEAYKYAKHVKDNKSKGFVIYNFKKKLVDLSDIKINLKGKK